MAYRCLDAVELQERISSYEVASAIGITQKSAWFMMHRIRLAMRDGEPEKIGSVEGGEVQVDETFIGGKPANMHKARRVKIVKEKYAKPKNQGGWTATGKTAVMGMFDRESRQIRAKVVPNVKRETLQTQILNGIHFGSRIYSDQAVAYNTLNAHYIHETVNHLEHYVQGQVHTNCLENFWSLTKRNLRGTYVCVEPFHLDRYVDEQVFRFNNRIGMNDGDRLDTVISRVVGKRLTYADLTGKTQAIARQG